MRRLLCAAFWFLLAACGSKTEGIELHLFLWRPENPAIWKEAVSKFEKAHPGVRVSIETGPNDSTQLHELLTQKLKNRDPSVDAFLMDVVWTPEFAAAGWARPLDRSFPEAERRSFFPGCIDSVTWKGKTYGVPFITDAGILYYRKDLLAKYGKSAPGTWPELVADVRTIESGENDPSLAGLSCQLKQYEGLVCNMLEYVRGNGGRLLQPASEATIAAVTFVRDEIVGKAAPRGVLTYEEQESLDRFQTGGAVFLRSWPYAWAICQRSPKVKGKVAIAKLPAFPGGRSASALGGWNFGISRYSRHPQEAYELVRFLSSESVLKRFAVEGGRAPSRPALYEDREVLAANPHYRDLEPVFETAVPRPKSPIYPEISHILQRDLYEAISEKDSDVKALMKDAAEKIGEAEARIR